MLHRLASRPRAGRRLTTHLGVATAVALAVLLSLIGCTTEPAAAPLETVAAGQEAEKDDDASPKKGIPLDLDGGVAWLNTAGPLDLEGPQGQDRPARLLDALLHQLHPHPARPGQAREEVRQRARRHRRPLGQVRQREGHREHPQGDPPLRDRAPGRQRRRHDDLEDATASAPGRRCAHRPGGQPRRPRSPARATTTLLDEVHRQARSRTTRRRRRSTRSRSGSTWRSARTATARCSSPARCWPTPTSKRLFIADSTHHRIVITDLDGKKIAVAGTGEPGTKDGAFDEATFDDPQGMALDGDTLYVADRKNHLIRAST